ncbi:oligoribonuclease [Shewanella phage vB_SspS_KASIA]|nr:oligoribonuclease [Shewanella phage vB_SspS_KASIA]
MELVLKHKVGDVLFAALTFNEVTFDDKLPVVKVEVESFSFNGKVYEDVEDLSVWYHVREADGWATLTLSGDVLFADEDLAKESAKSKLLTSLQKAKERVLRLECMSQC